MPWRVARETLSTMLVLMMVVMVVVVGPPYQAQYKALGERREKCISVFEMLMSIEGPR